MKGYYPILITALFAFAACNESGRGNDSNLREDRDEAAAESNTDKFGGKKQKDADFVYEAVESSYGEIKLAELGHQRSRNREVKEIAQMLLTDHTASLNDLKTVAQAKAISVPVEESDVLKRKVEKMADESDEDFDRSWLKEMIDVHEKNVSKFEDRFENTEDEELKTYISKTLPVLKKHKEHLKACDEKLKKSRS